MRLLKLSFKLQIASSVLPDWPISGREVDDVLQASPMDTISPTFRLVYQPEIIISKILKTFLLTETPMG